MFLRISEQSGIQNPRDYAASAVEDLRGLLAAGGDARRDARREHFYEVENAHETFYIHVSPISGNVVLLAKWSHQAQNACLSAAHQTA